MGVQEDNDKKEVKLDSETAAVRKIAETEAGVIFFRWLKKRCFFERSIISGNPDTYDVNTIGSIAQEFQRRIYLDIRRGFSTEAKIKIEVDQDKQ